jgi:hypothetical protein
MVNDTLEERIRARIGELTKYQATYEREASLELARIGAAIGELRALLPEEENKVQVPPPKEPEDSE